MRKEGCFVKSLWKGLVVFLFMVLGFSFPAFGASLNVGEATGAPGSDVTIPITLVTGGLQIASTANDIGFNTSLLENPRAAIGPAGTGAGKFVVSSSPSPGVFRVGVVGFNTNSMSDGVVANVTFKIKDTASCGDTPLGNTPSASDPGGNPVSVSGSNGLIHIPCAPPAQLNLGSGQGAPGGSATLPITLVTNGRSISATSNDLQYDSYLLLNPRATVGPAGTTAGKSVVSNVVHPGLFRIGVLSIQNNTPIGDGVVANVTFDIAPSAGIGTEIPVGNTPSASDPSGVLVPVEGTNGMITVGGVEITPSSFPSIFEGVHGFAGVLGQWQLQVTGGTSPYSWSVVGGRLPNGLSLDASSGLISGGPLEVGAFPFTVRVVDHGGLEGTKNLSLEIILLGDADGNDAVAINELQIVINSYLGIYPLAP